MAILILVFVVCLVAAQTPKPASPPPRALTVPPVSISEEARCRRNAPCSKRSPPTPDDDALRLIYADWLDDHGEPDRAEFIRLQCGRARLDEDDPRYDSYRTREIVLLLGQWRFWLGPALGWAERIAFRRGFLHRFQIDANAFLSVAESLFRWAPAAVVQLRDADGALVPLARSPALAMLSGLEFLDGAFAAADANALTTFLASPWLINLRELEISFTDAGSTVARWLAGSSSLPVLRRLALSACSLSSSFADFCGVHE